MTRPPEVPGRWILHVFIAAQHDVPEELAGAVPVHDRTGVTCAVGNVDTKERTKMATSFAKTAPGHIYRLDSTSRMIMMGERDVIELWGIGRRTIARLGVHGVRTVALARALIPGQNQSFGS